MNINICMYIKYVSANFIANIINVNPILEIKRVDIYIYIYIYIYSAGFVVLPIIKVAGKCLIVRCYKIQISKTDMVNATSINTCRIMF